MLLAMYLDQVIGSGIRKHPLFFLKREFWISSYGTKEARARARRAQPEYVAVPGEPADVAAERLRVFNDQSLALRALNMGKLYPGKFF